MDSRDNTVWEILYRPEIPVTEYTEQEPFARHLFSYLRRLRQFLESVVEMDAWGGPLFESNAREPLLEIVRKFRAECVSASFLPESQKGSEGKKKQTRQRSRMPLRRLGRQAGISRYLPNSLELCSTRRKSE